MKFSEHFTPHKNLAEMLLAEAVGGRGDSSHDASHLLRVWNNVQLISAAEGGDREVLVAATLLHDCVHVEKDSPLRAKASQLAAEKALAILHQLGWNKQKAEMVGHAIEAHSFSAQIEPRTTEAKVLQDADRLDAIGYIGIARCFYVSGRLGRSLYDPDDPIGTDRDLDDMTFAIDHFQTKLLKLSVSFQTKAGFELAKKRHEVVQEFLDNFVAEVAGGVERIE